MKALLGSLHFKIASGVIVTIMLVSAVFFCADYLSNRRQLLAELQESADQLAAVSLQGLLELAMMGEHPELLQQAIERLGEISSVQRIMLLDPDGFVRFSSDPAYLSRKFEMEEDGCRQCHAVPSGLTGRSVYFESEEQEVLRSASPVPNREECHSCHGSERIYNGVLLIDFPTARVWDVLRASVRDRLLFSGLTVLFTLIVLGLLLNRLVILPIVRLSRATASLTRDGSGEELEVLGGSDEIGQLTMAFESMTHRIQNSITQLRSQRTYLQNLINSLPDGLIVLGREGAVEMTNRAAESIWTPEELRAVFNKSSDVPEIDTALKHVLESPELVTCQVRRDPETTTGSTRDPMFYEIYFSPVEGDKGEVEKVILLVRDITQRKAFQQQASRAERLASVGHLAAGFAHEINNPMAAITTCIEGLSRHLATSTGIDASEKDEINEYLSTVGEAAMRCKEITQRLLSASVEHSPGDYCPVDLVEVVRNAIMLVKHQAQRQGLVINLEKDPGRLHVMGNQEKMSQLVLNLLLNSLEAVDGNGRIDVRCSRVSEFVHLRISDNGSGIAEEDLERIFDPFFTTKTEGRGTGLGLSISQWIVRQHHAKMCVQSKPGEGATFSILFPSLPEVRG